MSDHMATPSKCSESDVNEVYRTPANAVRAPGVFKNFNTIEEFKAADKNALLNQVSDEVHQPYEVSMIPADAYQIWAAIIKTRSTDLLTRFILIAFADLKKFCRNLLI